MPVYFSWIPRISYFSFASDALAINEFTGQAFRAPPAFLNSPEAALLAAAPGAAGGLAPAGDGCALVPAEAFLPTLATASGLGVTGNVLVLFGITVGLRVLAYGLLEAAATLNKV